MTFDDAVAAAAPDFYLTSGDDFSKRIYDKVVAKLKSEAIEDFRIDFEDGYGNRSKIGRASCRERVSSPV